MFILSLCATCSVGIHHVIRKASSDWLLKFMNISKASSKQHIVHDDKKAE